MSNHEISSEDSVRYAGFWPRVVADCIDSLILDGISIALTLIILGFAYWGQVSLGRLEALASSGSELTFMSAINPFFLQLILIVFRLSLALVYFTLATYEYGTTLGKRCLKIKVVSERKNSNLEYEPISRHQSLIRCLAYIISYLPAGAGFLMAMFHPEKRALHDLIAGTVCIRRKK